MELLEGRIPNITDIVCVQSAVLECQNIYKPLRLEQQILECGMLEVSLTCWMCLRRDKLGFACCIARPHAFGWDAARSICERLEAPTD